MITSMNGTFFIKLFSNETYKEEEYEITKSYFIK